MAKFDSTSLPQTNDPKEIQKMGLDLLDKINKTNDSIPTIPSTGATSYIVGDSDRSATLVVNTSTNTAGVWSAAVKMTGVPAGAKAAWCLCTILNAGVSTAFCVEAATGYTLSDITSGTNQYKYWGLWTVAANFQMAGILKIHLDTNGQFKWCTKANTSTVTIGSAIDYEM